MSTEESKPSSKPKTKKKTSHKLHKLVIVESPSKANTIKKYLGKDYEVKASVGHIIDLPKSRTGVDLTTFEPDYIIMRDKYKVLKELREAVKGASEVILASDPDREGEAIAWHIKNDFEKNVFPKIKDRTIPIKRIKFNEITESEVRKSIDMAEPIDAKLVDAQQGRRVIDRIFGYQLSPLLWKKVKSKLSAGRVQSVALRIICEKEEEIDKFIPVEYWNIDVEYKKEKAKFMAELTKIDGKKCEIGNAEDAERIAKEIGSDASAVKDIREKQTSRNALAPFITSTLQQTANNVYGYPSMKTMVIAQQLYEGVDIGKDRTGLITYMRTDSTRVSQQALDQVREYIGKTFGAQSLPEKPNTFTNKKSSQDAHEAIRPSSVHYHPDEIKQYLTPEQYKVYNLIWKRFVASQMTPSVSSQTTIEIANGNKTLTATSSKIVFDGYQKVYDFNRNGKDKELPHNLVIGDVLETLKVEKEQKFTEPPSRYNDASLVKAMEELGIGRPSTYAPTIFTITKRYYVKKESRNYVPTFLGKAVNKMLVDNFPELVDVSFTANMEEELDEVEEGQKAWKDVVKDFYQTFEPVLKKAYDHIDSIKGSFDQDTEYVCEKCGKKMVKRLGKYGLFLACSGWPECRNAKPIPLGKCPKCEKGLVVSKKGKKGKGRYFYGCSSYPDCDFVTYLVPAQVEDKPVNCPKDGSVLFVQKEKGRTKHVCLKEGCGYEKEEE